MASTSKHEPLIDNNPALQSYYHSLKSRIGYVLLLGGTRHFGFYEHETDSPFPIGASLGRMEYKLAQSLNLERGAKVLDAGRGVGHVACHLACHLAKNYG
jgi:sterol 24-C-methyltransferase